MDFCQFERRVLDQARDERNPLLERVKFLGILGRNLDEFVMVRGREWMASPSAKRLTRKTHALLRDGYRVLQRDLVPALAGAGIHLVDFASLTCEERADVDRRFTETVLPFLTPVLSDATPLGDAPGSGLNFAVVIDDPPLDEGGVRLAIVRVPDRLPSLIPIARRGPAGPTDTFVWLHELIAANLHRLFPGVGVQSAHLFRVMRDADIVLKTCEPDELPARTIDAVRQRETNPILMMVIDRAAAAPIVDRLARELSVPPDAVVRARDVLDLKRLWEFSEVQRADLHYPALVPRIPPTVGPCMFTSIRRGDILLHHPFESFQPVIDLLRQAAADPAVERISATLYRTDRGQSPLVDALLDAARRGKHVRVIVELKARFDERHNAEWARALNAAGAQVIHAPAGLKVHAKMLLIGRREGTHLRRYAHVSTGNYSAFTSMVYTDLGLMTCDETIASDVEQLFEFMAGEAPAPDLRAVMAAPFTLRRGFESLVEREMAWAQRGEAGHIILKMNALIDPAAIDLLRRASQSGVHVDLIVRGFAALRPGVPGVSERIRVRSIVGRFLEHSRVWYFRNGGAEELFIGSADLRPRNFERRVEIVVPLKDRGLAHRVRYEILDTYLVDTMSAKELLPNGRYRRVTPRPGEPGISCQAVLQR
jgi:polyphosphate kinase